MSGDERDSAKGRVSFGLIAGMGGLRGEANPLRGVCAAFGVEVAHYCFITFSTISNGGCCPPPFLFIVL